MPVLVQSILAAVPRVGNVVALCGFVMLVYAIVGVELFKGLLHYRCALPGFVETPGHPGEEVLRHSRQLIERSGPSPWLLLPTTHGATPAAAATAASAASATSAASAASAAVTASAASAAAAAAAAATSIAASTAASTATSVAAASTAASTFMSMSSQRWGRSLRQGSEQAVFDTGRPCHATEDRCEIDSEPGSRCMYFDQSPSNGLMSFDNVGYASVVLLQALTFDDWTEAMYALMRAFTPWVTVYFLSIVIFGGFFVVNLFLAVIFEEMAKAGEERKFETMVSSQEESAPAAEDGKLDSFTGGAPAQGYVRWRRSEPSLPSTAAGRDAPQAQAVAAAVAAAVAGERAAARRLRTVCLPGFRSRSGSLRSGYWARSRATGHRGPLRAFRRARQAAANGSRPSARQTASISPPRGWWW